MKINRMAPAKSRKKVKRVAIAIELDKPYPHHLGVFRGILQYAREHEHWSTVVDPYVGQVADAGTGRRYDGIVGRIGRRATRAAATTAVPIVNTWTNSPARGLPGVLCDGRASGRLVAEHLLARGFPHFACMGFHRDRYGSTELAGFAETIETQGFATPRIFQTSLSFEASYASFSRFYDALLQWFADLPQPVGIHITHGVMAHYALQVCGELKLRVPFEVGIVTQYNPTSCLCADVTLSSIENNYEAVGYRAAELLDHFMSDRRRQGPAEPILIPPKGLSVRASTDAFLVGDPMVADALRFISNHVREAITVADVAAHLHITTRTLARRFEQVLGRTAKSEISRMRIEYIKRRLGDGEMALGDLALDCGFKSFSHFAVFFRRETGLTPTDYRRGLAVGAAPRANGG